MFLIKDMFVYLNKRRPMQTLSICPTRRGTAEQGPQGTTTTMLELIKHTDIDFMKLKKYAFAFSGVIVLLGLYAVFQIYAGRANLGIVLAGGTAIQVRFAQPVAMEQLRQSLAGGGFPEASLQAVPGENIFIIKVSAQGKGERVAREEVVGRAS